MIDIGDAAAVEALVRELRGAVGDPNRTDVKELAMVEYYRGILRGEDRSGALREVQKAMIASQDRWHPYYWAAFVPIGNWAPLPDAR